MAEAHVDWVSPEVLAILRCPICKGRLDLREEKLLCAPCRKTYPIVLGIPDLRLYEDPLIPLEDDYRKGDKVQAQAEKVSFADLVRYYWSLPTYPPTLPEMSARFIQHVLTDEARIQGYVEKIGSGGAFLEAGCGTAALVKVASAKFQLAVGCDVAYRWLLIARRRLQEAGLPVHLVCCCADHLPFPDGFFDSVASISLLEHMPDAGGAIREFGRTLKPHGSVFTWTVNRFSLAPEPHVRVWGVGFLPRRWMGPYVKWVKGIIYEKKYLLSCFEIRRFFRRTGVKRLEFSLPVVTAADWDHLGSMEKAGARVFGWLGKVPLVRQILVIVSPVILVVAKRKDAPAR